MNDLDKMIRLFEGAEYFEARAEDHYPHRGLIALALIVASWAAVGAVYALYRAFEALAS